MTATRFPRLRAVLRTAATWGVAWGAAGAALIALLALFDPNPAIESLPERVGMAVGAGVMWGVRFAVIGAVIGTAFASVIRLTYRGRRLSDISPVRFGLLGAVVGGVGVPLFLQTMNVLSGGAIPWGLVLDDGVWAALFGAAAAAGSIVLARRAESLPGGPGADALQPGDDHDALLAARPLATPIPARARTTRG